MLFRSMKKSGLSSALIVLHLLYIWLGLVVCFLIFRRLVQFLRVQSKVVEAQPSNSSEHAGFDPQTHSTDDFNVELSEYELSQLIDNLVHTERINYAELHCLEDLWKLVHQATDRLGWQPEQKLKAAMLTSLHNALGASEAHWWRSHLEFLIKMWKKETEQETRSRARKHARKVDDSGSTAANANGSDVVLIGASTASKTMTSASTSKATSSAPTMSATTVTMGTVAQPPLSTSRKRKGGAGSGGKRALIELMGVGAFLANVQKENAEKETEGKEDQTEEAEEIGRQDYVSGKRRRSRSTDRRHRRRRSSSCESGEASSTTSGDDDDDVDDGYRATIRSLVAKEPPPPPPPPRNRSDRRQRRDDYDMVHSSRPATLDDKRHYNNYENEDSASTTTAIPGVVYDSAKATSSSVSQVQSAWMAQTMPAMMQMMPVMMQLFQQQQRGALSVNPQHFQQQFAQLYQQIQAQMGGAQGGGVSSFSAASNQMMTQMAQMAQQRLTAMPQAQPIPQPLLQQAMPPHGFQQISSTPSLAPPYAQQHASPYTSYR